MAPECRVQTFSRLFLFPSSHDQILQYNIKSRGDNFRYLYSTLLTYVVLLIETAIPSMSNPITTFAMYLTCTLVAPASPRLTTHPFPSLPFSFSFRRNTVRRCMPAAPALWMDGWMHQATIMHGMGDPRGFFKKKSMVRYGIHLLYERSE